ncbi:MAG: hypothetical protein GXY43_09090 [Clostridiaceae bacterium]|nr:hypothetical protein [Clostridiaceae bacterium]
MKKLLVCVLIAFSVWSVFGCKDSDSAATENETSEEAAAVGETERTDRETEPDATTKPVQTEDENTRVSDDPRELSEEEIRSIDWNTDAYSKYYVVVTGETVIHYWNGGETALMQLPDMLIYVSGNESLAVDLKTGHISEGFGGSMVPPASDMSGGQQDPGSYDFSGVDYDPEADMYVFRYSVEGGEATYFVNRELVCVGWEYDSPIGIVSVLLNQSATFEEAVDDIFREHAKGTTEGGDDKYADTDGDGYSDWNEDRYPSTEEFDYLTDLWKSEGLTGGEYFDKIDSLGLLAPD